jgi:BirA family biotin operon repressor/biotin-[acetyl-CoA-carboxylase] ligase
VTWFGWTGEALAASLGLPQVEAHVVCRSTMDLAHAHAAAGAPGGTLVIAEAQEGGRGRNGKVWSSAMRAGIWMTLVERPRGDATALDLLSVRVGLRLAPVLDRWTSAPVRLKWPNDLWVGERKLAGVLVETRWRGMHPDWVAIGVGINLEGPADHPQATALEGADPVEVLGEVIPALRAAANAGGALRDDELADFAARDVAKGRTLAEPIAGVARGLSPLGELLVATSEGITAVRAGSLTFATV